MSENDLNAAIKVAEEHGWYFMHSEVTLTPGPSVGAPTEQKCRVTLVPERPTVENFPSSVSATGEGPTLMEAVRRALGVVA